MGALVTEECLDEAIFGNDLNLVLEEFSKAIGGDGPDFFNGERVAHDVQ